MRFGLGLSGVLAFSIFFFQSSAPAADPNHVFPAPAIKRELSKHVGKLPNIGPLNQTLPLYWIQLDGQYIQNIGDTQQITHITKLLQSLNDGIATPEIVLGNNDAELLYWGERRLTLVFYQIVQERQAVATGGGYPNATTLQTREVTKLYDNKNQAYYWNIFFNHAREVLNATCLEDFSSVRKRPAFFGILLEGSPIDDETEEERVRQRVFLFLSGEKIGDITADAHGKLVFEGKPLELKWYYSREGGNGQAMSIGDRFEMMARLRRHGRYLLFPTPARGEVSLRKLTVPKVRDGANYRTPPREYQPGIPTAEFAERLSHFKALMDFIRSFDADLATRLQEEIDNTKVETLEVETLNGGPAVLMTDLIHHYGRGIIRVAGRGFPQLDVNRTDECNQSYALLFALFEGLRPLDDLERPMKAHEMMLKLMDLEHNHRRSSIEKGYKTHVPEIPAGTTPQDLDGTPIARQEVEPVLTQFALSNRTLLLQAMVEHFRDICRQERDWLAHAGAGSTELYRDLDNIQSLVEQRAQWSTARDYSEVLHRPIDQTLPKISDDFAAFRLRVWDTLNRLKPRVERRDIERKLEAISLAVEMIAKGDITAADLQRLKRNSR